MIKLLLLALFIFLGYTLYSALRQSLGSGPPARRPPSGPSGEGEDMVKDPCCGTYVPKNEAVRASIRGEPLFFCSTGCRDRYKADRCESD